MEKKHKFIFEYAGGKIECYNTQAEIAKMLADPSVKLISVNDSGAYCGTYRRKSKKKGSGKNV